MGIGVIVGVGIIVDIGFGESVGDAIGPEIAPHPIRAAKSNNANNKMPALKKMVFLFIMSPLTDYCTAQRPAAQPVPRAMSIGDFSMRRIREWGPHGRNRFIVIILAGFPQLHSGVLNLSLG